MKLIYIPGLMPDILILITPTVMEPQYNVSWVGLFVS
jgi:hypothetical protein